MDILSIDPGPVNSAFTRFSISCGIIRDIEASIKVNHLLFHDLRIREDFRVEIFAIEKVVSFGVAVGKEVMDTAMVAGAFAGCYSHYPVYLIPRAKIRFHLSGTKRSGDPQVRAAILQRFPEIHGRKLSRDMWSAFAVGITAYDLYMNGGAEKYVCKFR